MASAVKMMKSLSSIKSLLLRSLSVRSLSTSQSHRDVTEGWLSKLLVRKIEPTKESHSRMLSDKDVIYELQTHNVKPSSMKDYINNYSQFTEAVHAQKDMQMELVASWSVTVGDQDQCLHLWKYIGGYNTIDKVSKVIHSENDISKLIQERGNYLRARHTQYLLSFSFWPQISPRTGGNMYEIRSYQLKPGTMIEWGNNWARAIHFRQHNNEAFAGFFSQVGRLYNVHHIWCYKDLADRKDTREAAWRKPGWDECVAYTVPLIQVYQSRILLPNQFSPTQ